MNLSQKTPLLAVVGPTASGKSRLSVLLAQALGGEVLSCDSMQIYRRMDIGTAKPSPSEMGGVPHHLIDFVDPREPFSVGDYVRAAKPLIGEVASRGVLPILCGGTGLYLDRLVCGESLTPATEPNEAIRAELLACKETLGAIFEYLADGYPKRTLLSAKTAPTVRLSENDFAALSREMEKLRAISPDDVKRRKTAIRTLLIKLFADVFFSFVPDEDPVPEWLILTLEKTRSEMRFAEGISGMIELSGKTREHLARSLQKYFGKSPSEFINELRLNF